MNARLSNWNIVSWVAFGLGVCLSTAGAAIDLKEVHDRHATKPPAHQNWLTPLLLGMFHGLALIHKIYAGYTIVYANTSSMEAWMRGCSAFAPCFVAYAGMLLWFSSAGYAMHFDDKHTHKEVLAMSITPPCFFTIIYAIMIVELKTGTFENKTSDRIIDLTSSNKARNEVGISKSALQHVAGFRKSLHASNLLLTHAV